MIIRVASLQSFYRKARDSAQSNVNENGMSGDAKHYDHATPWNGDMVGGTNKMEIESRCLDEYGKMSIESREKKKKKENVSGDDKPSSKVHIVTN